MRAWQALPIVPGVWASNRDGLPYPSERIYEVRRISEQSYVLFIEHRRLLTGLRIAFCNTATKDSSGSLAVASMSSFNIAL